LISESNKKRIRAIQYNALRISFRKPIKTKNEELLQLSHATKLDDRIEHLNKRYFINCLKYNNELIKDIILKFKIGIQLIENANTKLYYATTKEFLNKI
jgi:hypothetical protein